MELARARCPDAKGRLTSAAVLTGWIRRGLLPTPSYRLGPRSPRWDRLELDSWFGTSVKPSLDISETVANFVANLKQTSRARRAQETCERENQRILPSEK